MSVSRGITMAAMAWGLTVLGAVGQAQAQTPPSLAPLPDAPQPPIVGSTVIVPPPSPMIPVPPGLNAGCTPGHCSHRTVLTRRRCKRKLQELFLGFPEEFERPALGALMHQANAIQVGNAEAASMILRPYDFESGTVMLNQRGRDKLAVIEARLPSSFSPVVIERTKSSVIDEARRSAVLAALVKGSFPIPSERVVVGPSVSGGLAGQDAELIHVDTLLRTSKGGPPVGVGTVSSAPGSR